MSRRRGCLRRLLVFGSITLLVLVLVSLPVAWWAKGEVDRITADLPSDLSGLSTWRPPTACKVVDRAGQPLDTFYVERRFPADHEAMPDHVWQAFVAAEDSAFFQHPGVDAFGILRALVVNARAGHTVQGGSTLTQQVVKNTLLTPERSLERKIKEAVLALRLEQELSKEDILALYLDLVYLGSNNYGIEAASLDYFGVSATELSLPQAALLAGLVPAPSRNSPRVNPQEALRRRTLVLRRMLEDGYIDAATMVLANESPLQLADRVVGKSVAQENGYLTAVRREIRRVFGPDAAKEGLTVTVPLDPEIQNVAELAAHEAATSHLDRNGPRVIVRRDTEEVPGDPDTDDACFPMRVDRYRRELKTASRTLKPGGRFWWLPVHDDTWGKRRPLLEVVRTGDWVQVCPGVDELLLPNEPWAESAVVVIHNDTGEVVALAHSKPTALEGFVPALQARRQPGSSFKPYVYGAALLGGLTPVSEVTDAPISLPAGNGRYWTPKNYAGGYAGRISLSTALAISANTVAVRLISQTGADPVIGLAHDLGVQTPIREGDLTIALGTSEVTPIDQAAAYSSIARMGEFLRPTWIRKAVLDYGDHTVDRTPVRNRQRVMPAGAAYELMQMMEAVVQRGSGRAARMDGVRVAGKTGTTNDNVDAWFVGYTPDYTIAVWVGTDSNRSLGAKETGGRAAAPAWAKVAAALPEGAADWSVPDEVVRITWGNDVVGIRRSRVPENILPSRVPTGPLPPLE